MQVKINGKPEEIRNGTVLDLLKRKISSRTWLPLKSTTSSWTVTISRRPTSMKETIWNFSFIWEAVGE